MMAGKIIIFMTLMLFISGCSPTNIIDIPVKSYMNNDFGINLNYPEKWVVTEQPMGPRQIWLVIGEKEFNMFEGNAWPYVTIIGFKPSDMSIISDQLEKLKEDNDGKELTKNSVEINGRKYMKYETDEKWNGEFKAKRVSYVLEEKEISLLVKTIEINEKSPISFKNEINEIIHSIKMKE